ncbi:MAG: hypothetical protein IK130_10255 [Oscillospiraceae bacterium]|nr:hypothetical protein [Oscillospiraceae bacterium]
MQKPEPAGRLFLRENPILREALFAAPLAVCADSVSRAMMLCFVFCIVTAGTVLLSRLIPQRLAHPFRIVSYSLTAVLVYVPAAFAADYLLPESGAGVYLSLIAAGLYLSVEQETVFPRGQALFPLLRRLCCIMGGVCAVTLGFGLLRELLGAGTVIGRVCFAAPPLPILSTPAAGLIMLALFCILTERFCRTREDE